MLSTTDADVATIDARETHTIDPEFLVWVMDAFRGFAPSSQYATVRKIIGDSIRSTRRVRRDDPLLPTMRCGAPMPHGRQCGRSIRPHVTAKEGKFHYVGPHCSQRSAGHTAVYSRAIETAVLDILRTEYDTDQMRRAAESVVVRARSMRIRIRAIERELTQTQQRLIALGKRELDAVAAAEAVPSDQSAVPTSDSSDLMLTGAPNALHDTGIAADAAAEWRHLQRLRTQLLREERSLQAERDGLSSALDGVASDALLGRQLARIRHLADNFSRLLNQAMHHRGMVRALVGILTRRISLRTLGPSLALVEVELPNGALTQRLVVTGAIRVTQPELAWARARLAGGATPSAVADEWPQPERSRANMRRVLPDSVTAFALLYEYGPRVPARMGPLETARGIAARAHVTEHDVVRAALAGTLGPAVAGAMGEYLLAPTDRELWDVSPALGAKAAAAAFGCTPDDLVDLTQLAREHGVDVTTLRSAHQVLPRHVRRGVDRRLYVRRSELPSTLVTTTSSDERARDRAARYAAAVRDTVREAGYDPQVAHDFVPLLDLMESFRRRFAVGSPASVWYARQAGTLITLDYRGPSPHVDRPRPRLLVYCPSSVRETDDGVVVREWMRGVLPSGAVLPTRREAGRHRTRRNAHGSTR